MSIGPFVGAGLSLGTPTIQSSAMSGGTSGAFTSSGSKFTLYLGARNRVLLARKRYGALWPLLAVIGMILALDQLVRARSFRRFYLALEGWWAGVCDERGAPKFVIKQQGAKG